VEKYSGPILNVALKQLSDKQTKFVGAHCLAYSLKFIQQATKVQSTMAVLSAYVKDILHSSLIPLMLISQKDATQFQEEPIEYIRKQTDFTDSYYNPKNSALDLMSVLCEIKSEKKQKLPDYLPGFLSFCLENLNQYKA